MQIELIYCRCYFDATIWKELGIFSGTDVWNWIITLQMPSFLWCCCSAVWNWTVLLYVYEKNWIVACWVDVLYCITSWGSDAVFSKMMVLMVCICYYMIVCVVIVHGMKLSIAICKLKIGLVTILGYRLCTKYCAWKFQKLP